MSFAVAAVVTFYMCSALVMVFVNKAVLISTPSLPLLFLFFQLIIAVILLHISAFATSSTRFAGRIDLPTPTFTVFKSLIPVIVVNVVGLVFNTLCLRDVEASFFQIARGLQLPLTILVSTLWTRPITRPSLKVITAASIVTIGFFIGIAPGSLASASAAGFIPLRSLLYGFLSSLFIAIHAVLIKTSLPHCNNSTIQLAWWSNAVSAVFLFPFILLTGEIGIFQELLSTRVMDGAPWDPKTFICGSLVTGFFGFLLCIAGLLSIKITSPITHMFSSAARSVLQTLLGVCIFGDLLTVNRATSILVILGGTILYTYIKHIETLNRPPKGSQELPRYMPVSTTPKADHEEVELSLSMRKDYDDMTLEELENEILGADINSGKT